jgi:hypothetical protein
MLSKINLGYAKLDLILKCSHNDSTFSQVPPNFTLTLVNGTLRKLIMKWKGKILSKKLFLLSELVSNLLTVRYFILDQNLWFNQKAVQCTFNEWRTNLIFFKQNFIHKIDSRAKAPINIYYWIEPSFLFEMP